MGWHPLLLAAELGEVPGVALQLVQLLLSRAAHLCRLAQLALPARRQLLSLPPQLHQQLGLGLHRPACPGLRLAPASRHPAQ